MKKVSPSHNGNDGISSDLINNLRVVKKKFIQEVFPAIKRHRHFVSNRQRRRAKKEKSYIFAKNQITIKFSPFAMTLGHGLINVLPRLQPQKFLPNLVPKPATLPNQLVRVFVVAVIQSNPQLYVLQKIQRKNARGFPSGRIEEGEIILQAAAREFKEESCGREARAGVDISQYNPVCIGTFVLKKATTDERGAVIIVELPEKEMINIIPGGGDQEDEVVEKIYFLTFEELLEIAEEGSILANSKTVLDLYLNHLVS